MLKRNDNALVNNIMTSLRTAILKVKVLEDGNMVDGEIDFLTETDQGKAVKFVGASDPEYSQGYTDGYMVGLNVVVEAVVRELVTYVLENVEIVAKPRIDNYGTEFDTLITAIDAAATTATGTGQVPVVGATLGTLLTAISTAMKVGQLTRNTLEAVENTEGTELK